ncbi:MAG: hypothetical protein C4B58_11350 [Deltaproteobacteria bacterium]|nr:MAG: hypothetical protein C4B58_11350 [Deltaproteobacteria bacterium]
MKKRSIFWAALFFLSLGVIVYTFTGLFSSHRLKDSPNVLIITMDTTRADHLGCYGYDKIQTPHIDAAAKEGVLFEEAFSVQPVTLPSHCSIFTGKYPFSHGVRDNNIYRLAEENLTLAEILKERDYVTAAFISSYILDRQFGLTQGFHFYNDRFLKPKQKGRLPIDRRAAEVSILACKWLDTFKEKKDERPFFLWLHYYDPHADYDPPSPYKEAYPNPYDGEIAYMDDWIGYVFDDLKLKDLWDNTIVVLVADHGESLGEYGEQTHGIFIYRPTTNVPLIIKYPEKLPQGVRSKERVSTIDIMPTVLDLLGIKAEEKFDGQSLISLIKDKRGINERAVYSEAFIPKGFNWSELKGIRKGKWCFIEAPRPELYQIEPGEKELESLIGKYPQQAEEIKSLLYAMLTETQQAKTEQVAVNEEMIERLKGLGYFVGGGQGGEEITTSQQDPKDMIKLFALYQRANGLVENESYGQAVALFEKIMEQDPDNPRFLMESADININLNKFKEAEKHLKHAVSIKGKDPRCHYLLGLCYENWDKTDMAIKEYKEAIALNHNHFLAYFHLGLIYTNTGQWEKAEHAFLETRRIKPDDVSTLNNLGYIAIKGKNDFQTGIDLIKQALKITPQNQTLLSSLGWAYYNVKDYKNAVTYLEAALALEPDNRMFIQQLKAIYKALGDKERLKQLEKREKFLEAV